MDLGTYVQYHGRPAVRFERTYAHSQQVVWSAVTEPTELAHWFPSTVEIEPVTGGAIHFSADPNLAPMTGTVLVFDPPNRLGFSWGEDELYFELEPAEDGGCRFTLTNVLAAADTAARNGAGWNVCLAELARQLDTGLGAGPHSAGAQPWKVYYDAYLAAGVPAGAPVPGMAD